MFSPLDRWDSKKELGENMGRNLAFMGAARPASRSVSSLACLAFVVLLGLAFWAGAVWIGQFLLRLSSTGF
jgi:hypothetical protein